MKIRNICGEKFGKLTVIKLCNTRTKNSTAIWHCKCDCGTEIDVPSRRLVTGHTKSCGCLKSRNYIGKKFNHLTIMDKFKINKTPYYKCKCDCGNICIKIANNVVRGTTKTCGCKIELITHKQNKILKDDKYAYIYVKGIKEPAIIDIDDYEKVKDFHWERNKSNYIYTRKSTGRKYVRTFLHRLIMPISEDNLFIDHINGNPLDNRKSNLRIVTKQQNSWNRKIPINNTTGCKGVTLRHGKFICNITYNKNVIYLGTFKSVEEANSVRQNAEIKYYGEYRR